MRHNPNEWQFYCGNDATRHSVSWIHGDYIWIAYSYLMKRAARQFEVVLVHIPSDAFAITSVCYENYWDGDLPKYTAHLMKELNEAVFGEAS